MLRQGIMLLMTVELLQPGEQRFLTWTDWDGYVQCREALDESGVRITYDRGRMELMSPSPEHEQGKSDLGRVLEVYLQEIGMDFSTGGSPTMRKRAADQGLEPDECYYLGPNATGRLGPAPEGLNIRPPDLAIEIEVTRSAIDRLKIFAGLRIPEVWRYDYNEHVITVHLLRKGAAYVESQSSKLLPSLPVQMLAGFVHRGSELTTARLIADVRDWVRRGCPAH